MQSEKSGVLFARIAGVLIVACNAYWVYNNIIGLVEMHDSIYFKEMFFDEIVNLVDCVACLVMGALVLMRNKSKLLIVTAGIHLAIGIYSMVSYPYVLVLLNVLGSAVLFLNFLFISVFVNQERLKITKFICFLPVIIMVITQFINGSPQIYLKNLSTYWRSAIVLVCWIVGNMFLGLWIWCECSNKLNSLASKVPVNVNFANSSNTHSSTASSVIGGADKLKAYKELLDSGVITEEEFEKMKQEVLGL